MWVTYIVLSKGTQTGYNGTADGAKWYLVTGKTVFAKYVPLIAYPVGEVTGYFNTEVLRKCSW